MKLMKAAAAALMIHAVVLLIMAVILGIATVNRIIPENWIQIESIVIATMASVISGREFKLRVKEKKIKMLLIHSAVIIVSYGILHLIMPEPKPFQNGWIAAGVLLGTTIGEGMDKRAGKIKYR